MNREQQLPIFVLYNINQLLKQTRYYLLTIRTAVVIVNLHGFEIVNI